MWSSCKLDVEEAVDIKSLANYAGLCVGRRQAMLDEYLRTHQIEGRLEWGHQLYLPAVFTEIDPWAKHGEMVLQGSINAVGDARCQEGGTRAFLCRTRRGQLLPDLYYSPLPRYEFPCLGSIYRAC